VPYVIMQIRKIRTLSRKDAKGKNQKQYNQGPIEQVTGRKKSLLIFQE